QAGEVAGLEQVLDVQALLAWERAVVRASYLVLGKLVQPQREPLGAAAVVDEHDRRAVLPDELEQLGIDRGPDRAAGGARPVGDLAELEVAVRLAHVLDRHADLQVERLAQPGVDDRAVTLRPDEEAPDLLERP